MCGPPECTLCAPGFWRKLRYDRLTQVWALLWVPLVVLWFIYFAFSIGKLATSKEDKSFQVQLNMHTTVPMPAWTICADEANGITSIICSLDGVQTNPKVYNDGCYGYNDQNQNLKANLKSGSVNCIIDFKDGNQTARTFVHDPIYSADIHDRKSGQSVYDILKEIPSGLCTEAIQPNGHTFLWWKRVVFDFMRSSDIVGFERVDSYVEHGRSVEGMPNSALFTLEIGDFYEWRYKEVQWWSGYDFWYFLGMVGGLSFLVLLIHAVFFYPLKRLLYHLIPEEMQPETDVEEAERPLSMRREGSGARLSTDSDVEGSASTPPSYDTL